jgi:hypothetical protein
MGLVLVDEAEGGKVMNVRGTSERYVAPMAALKGSIVWYNEPR